MITPDFASEIKQQGFEVIAMGHAYRINGCIDVWYNGTTLYDKNKNVYEKFKIKEQLISRAIKLAAEYGKQEAFKKTAKGGMSYQEFKHQERINTTEYYHWDHNEKEISDDHLYFIKSGFNIKIGRSKTPEKRLSTLSTGIAEKPILLLVIKNKGCMESVLHRCFTEWRVRKNAEWFTYSNRIKEFIIWLKRTKTAVIVTCEGH